MQIHELAAQTGVSVDTVRYYEKKGLIGAGYFTRRENGYRDYSEQAVERLRMIKLGQTAGFSLSEIGELLDLWDNQQLTDDLIAHRLQEKYAAITAKIAEMEQIRCYIGDKLVQMGHQPEVMAE